VIDVSATVRAILDGGSSFRYWVSVQAWLGDQLLADVVPVSAGNEESDRTLTVPERVQFTVPARVDGVDWAPVGDDDPLAAQGQTLKVSLGIDKGNDGVEWFQRGEFLVQESALSDDGSQVDVTAVGLLSLIDEAKFVSPFQPTGTIWSTVRDLIEPALTVDLTGAPADRAVPTSAVNWDSDRLGALNEVLDAWPAVPRMNEGGYLEIVPDVVPARADAVRSFTDGTGGTVIAARGSSTRDGGFNVVVVTGQATDGGEVRGVAYVGSGPWAYGTGPANPLPVPFSYSSPLLATQPQCAAAAQTVLRRKMREAVLKRYDVTAVPDPTLQLGDPVLLSFGGGPELLCTVEQMQLPYFATGPMQLQVVTAI
jgi:uncharacterized protein DUF5047